MVTFWGVCFLTFCDLNAPSRVFQVTPHSKNIPNKGFCRGHTKIDDQSKIIFTQLLTTNLDPPCGSKSGLLLVQCDRGRKEKGEETVFLIF